MILSDSIRQRLQLVLDGDKVTSCQRNQSDVSLRGSSCSAGASCLISTEDARTESFDMLLQTLLQHTKLTGRIPPLLKTVCSSALRAPESLTSVLPDDLFLRQFSSAALKNQRRKMEDRHICIPNLKLFSWNLDAMDYSYFAVLDGHRGQEAANFAASHLLPEVIRSPHFSSDLSLALTDAFAIVNCMLTKRSQTLNIQSGSTCVCAIISRKSLNIAWIGDSQAVLIRNGKAELLTPPHNTSNESECSRIEGLNGLIIDVQGQRRVNGVLSVTRSFGDVSLAPLVSAVPELVHLDLTGGEDILVLASDGVWDVLTPEDCASLFRKYCQSNSSYENIAAEITQLAKEKGSPDNLTCVVTFLRSWEKLQEFYAA